MYLKEADEDQTVLMTSDIEYGPVNKKRKEGGAFRGTVLGRSPRDASSSVSEPGEGSEHVTSMQADSEPPGILQCPACTFINDLSNAACEMCGTIFS